MCLKIKNINNFGISDKKNTQIFFCKFLLSGWDMYWINTIYAPLNVNYVSDKYISYR